MSLLMNPVLVSVVVLCLLCLFKLNVLMSLPLPARCWPAFLFLRP